MTPVSRYLLAAIAASSIFLSGCGAGVQAGPSASPIGAIKGRVHGGQPPISGTHVYILQPGTGGYGGPGIAASTTNASTSLLTGTGVLTDSVGGYVTTDQNGFFTITGLYNCTPNLPVYAYALGGNAGGGANTGIGMMAVLGNCPAGGGDLSGTVPYVWINEVTTIAAAYAMSGFASDPTHVATSGSTLAATGITNAFNNAGQIATLATGTALATTPGGNGTVPQTEINTLANILASCVNATDGAFANCTKLFGYATGASGDAAPTDTARAAINLAHAPAVNTSSLYGMQAGLAAPFLPDLSAAPNDFSVSLIFTGGGMVTPTTVAVHDLAVDGSGNVWMAIPTPNLVSEFSPLGTVLKQVAATTTGTNPNNLSTPVSVALDAASANVWIANNAGKTVTELSTTDGSTVGNYTIYSAGTTNALSGPSDLELDGSGNLWISNYTTSSLVKASVTAVTTPTPSTTVAYVSAATDTTHFKSAEGVAIAAGTAGVVFVGTGSAKYAPFATNAGAYSASVGLTFYAFVPLVDASGNAWYIEDTKNIAKAVPVPATPAITKTEYATVQAKDYYYQTYYSGAVDGAGNIVLPDTSNGLFQIFNNSGVDINGNGYVPPGTTNYVVNAVTPPTGYVRPFTMALDGSGNIWYNTLTDATLREMIGAAVPVATPLAYGVANSLLGTRP